MAGLHVKDRPRAARVALYTPKLSRNPRTVAMIRNADTAKRLSLHVIPTLCRQRRMLPRHLYHKGFSYSTYMVQTRFHRNTPAAA